MAVHALVMGFGGTGAHILTYLKEIAVLKQGKNPDTIKFLLVDTIAGWKPGQTVKILGGGGEEKLAQGEEINLDPNGEYFHVRDSHPPLRDYVFEHLAPGAIGAKNYPHLKDWLHAAWLGKYIAQDKLNINDGAAQQRQIGRFAMFQNMQGIVSYIDRALRELKNKAGDATINVWIIGSAAGGTGAGTLLDAAFMTRLVAARQIGSIQVSGVIVLPDIYSEKSGISLSRAYSLFRELDRFQEVSFGGIDHRYQIGNKQFSSEVSYDNTGQQRALVESRLFDNLFYLGKVCRSDPEREAFFSSVANALDPYLDEGQGRQLLEHSLNTVGFAASSFGAARLYVPQETYAELFAWEEVYELIRAITAPKIEGKQANNVHAGVPADRQNGARSKIENLLPLFQEIIKRDGKRPEDQAAFAKNSLDPKTIVTQWYQFAAAGIVGGIKTTPADVQKTKLAYTNPYFSLTEADSEKVDNREIVVKTHKENKDTKGPKEDQKISRDRFAEELVQCTRRYTDGGKGSFEEGRQIIFETLSQSLNNKVDKLIQDEMERGHQNMVESQTDPAEGTAMTRLYEEIKWAGTTLDSMFDTITLFLETLEQEENIRSSQVVNAAQTLQDSHPSKMPFVDWVTQPQALAREECANYIRWYQNRELLKDMQKLVQQVQTRFKDWAEAFRGIIEDLAISQPDRRAALEVISTEHLTRLQGRLHRLARNRSALISCQPEQPDGRDVSMQGYREELRHHAAGEGENRLAYRLLNNARWELTVDKGKPHIKLVAKWGDQPERSFNVGHELRNNFHQELQAYFRQEINVELDRRDIFDYLMYVQKQKGMSLADVTKLLDDAATVLLDTPALAEANWVYKEPADPDKRNLAEALHSALTRINSKATSPAELHSDRNAVTLLKVCKPAPHEVTNLNQCQQEYLTEQIKDESGDYNQDELLYRAQVYHPFRAELEAWYIERRHYHRLLNERIEAEKHISPRVARLLEHPDMMHAFIQCIATEVVKKDEQQQMWFFENKVLNKKIQLTTTEEPTADVMRAAVTFVLRQQEAKPGGMVKITLKHAQDSALKATQMLGKNLPDQVEAFVGKPTDTGRSDLDDFLNNHFKTEGLRPDMAEREKQNLKIIFQFYGDKNRRTHLGDRMELP